MNYPPELPRGVYSLVDGQIVEFINDSSDTGMKDWGILLSEDYFSVYNGLPSGTGEINITVDYVNPGIYSVEVIDQHGNRDFKFINLASQISALVSEILVDFTIEEYTYIFNVIASNIEKLIIYINDYKLNTKTHKRAKLI